MINLLFKFKIMGTNIGVGNSGNWNSGDRNSGYCNTNEPTLRMFNKDTSMNRDEVDKLIPQFFHFETNEWIQEVVMTKEEKKENPEYKTTGGYLKTVEYKDAWRISWDKASKEDKKKCLDLPNWNNELFLEISGIDVEKELESGGKKQELLEKANELIKKAEELKAEAEKF